MCISMSGCPLVTHLCCSFVLTREMQMFPTHACETQIKREEKGRNPRELLFPDLSWGFLLWEGRRTVPAKAWMGAGGLFQEPGLYQGPKGLWVKVKLATLDPSLPTTAPDWENPDPVTILHKKAGRWNSLLSRGWGFVCRTAGQHHRAEQNVCTANTRAFMVRLWFLSSWSHKLCNKSCRMFSA